MKPRLLDLFAGAGGCSVGYARAGFEVVGIDHAPQPRYPYEFHQADALEFCREHGHEFDVIHASPPCQAYTRISQRNQRAVARRHPDLLADTRAALLKTGRPYVIENVVEALPLMRHPVMLCGSSFGLDVRRHRLFESDLLLFGLHCNHSWQTPRFRSLDKRRGEKLASVVGVHGHINYSGEFALRCQAMDIDWMNAAELTQAIPPAFTEFLGTQLWDQIHLASPAPRRTVTR